MTPLLRIDVPTHREPPAAEPQRSDFSAALKRLDQHGGSRPGPGHGESPAPPRGKPASAEAGGEGDEAPTAGDGPAATRPSALPIIAAGCIVESARLFGEHLTAGGLLSLLSLADSATGVVQEASLREIADAPPAAAADTVSALSGYEAMAGTATSLPTGPMLGSLAERSGAWPDSRESGVDICRRAATCAGIPDAERWADKAMRLVRSPTGEAVLWLRDYRTARARLEPTIRALIAQAPGLRLHKIMLNGRRVWTSGVTQGSDDGH